MPKYKCRCGRKFSEADLTPGTALVCPDCRRRLNVDPHRLKAKLERRRAERRLTPGDDADEVELDDALSAPPTLATLSDLPPRPEPASAGPRPTLSDQATLVDGETRSDILNVPGLRPDETAIVDLAQRYQIQGPLGRGGMGEVVRAVDLRLKRPVAIKRLKPDVVDSVRALQRFLSEAQAVARLSHYNIVQIHDYGRAADGPFLVLELVDGPSLAEQLSRGKLPVDRAVEIACQVGEALALAHANGIIHRDVKPANILLTPSGNPKLTDFGVARQTQLDTAETREGAVLGTVDYMAPEQRSDSRRADARSDQWSLAATLYHMVTGELPRVIDLATIPEPLRAPLSRALRTRPEDRFASVDEFRRALREALKPRPPVVVSQPPPLPARVAAVPVVPPPQVSSGGWKIVAWGVALVIVAATGLWVVLQKRESQVPAVAAPELVDVIEHFDADKHRPRYHGQLKDGQRHGAWEAWHPNGTVWVTGNFENGRPRGTWQYFDDGGVACGTRIDGRRSGPWREWDARRVTLAEGHYVDDKPEGNWTFRSGQEPFLRVTYRKGVVQSVTIVSAGSTEAEYRRVGATPRFELAVVRGLMLGPRGSTQPLRFSIDDDTPGIRERLAEEGLPPLESFTWCAEGGPFDPPSITRPGLSPRDFVSRAGPPDLTALQAVYDKALAAATAAEKERLRQAAELEAVRDRLTRLRLRQTELEAQRETLARKRPAGATDLLALAGEYAQKQQDLEKLERQLESTGNNLEAARKQLLTLAQPKTPEAMKTSLKKSIDFTRESVGKGFLPIVNPATGAMSRRKIDSDQDRQTGQAMIQQLEDMYVALVNAEKSVNNQMHSLEDLAADRVPLEQRLRELKPQVRDAEEYEACQNELEAVQTQIRKLEGDRGASAP